MWVVFRKSDGAVVGASADSEIDIDKEKALAEVIAGREGLGNPEDYDAFQVTKQGTLRSWAESAARGMVRAEPTMTGGMDIVVGQAPRLSNIAITTDAKEFHPVDNVPLVPATPESFVVISLRKTDDQGTPLTSAEEDVDEIWLRASYGVLREDKAEAPQEIRQVRLASGAARFRLYSEGAKRLAIVQMLSANPNLILPGFQVEFV